MSSSVRLIPSGFKFVDDSWGGIYRGGSYVLVGPRKSGRTLMGLQFALESAKAQEVCLYFTNMRPKDLMIQAASLNFDIQSYMNQNLIIVVRVAPPYDIYDAPNSDNYLIDYLRDIITVVDQYKPGRIIFDELTPYIGFRNLDLLRDTFLSTLETIEEQDITSFFIVGEPATEKAQDIVSTVCQYVTGIIRLKKAANKINDKFHGGEVSITPNVGHTEGQFSFKYQIEPFKGVTLADVPKSIPKPEAPALFKQTEPKITPINNLSNNQPMPTFNNVPVQNETPAAAKEGFNNVYSFNDFQLILNNQIALFKSTGQRFTLAALKLDPAAQVNGLLTINQLQNAVKLSAERKDKICISDNIVMILIVRSNSDSIPNLLQTLVQNLPSSDQNYLDTVLQYISIYNIEADQNIDNAESMTENILSANVQGLQKFVPVNKFAN